MRALIYHSRGLGLSPLARVRGKCIPRVVRRDLTVLALESSADDSCAAIVEANDNTWDSSLTVAPVSSFSSSSSSSSSSSASSFSSASSASSSSTSKALAESAFGQGGLIRSNIVIKQHHLHGTYGGIHPIVAHEGHLTGIPLAISRALSESNLTLTQIDAVAYTRGPGMYGPLSVCAASARSIAAVTGKPLIGIHHMQAHALTVGLTDPNPPKFPFLTLLVSGGHTMLLLATGYDEFRILATTLDTSIGDAFDKYARTLCLPALPDRGLGPALEHFASLPPLPPYDTAPLPPLPLPLGRNKTRDSPAFSFAGLLVAAERLAKAQNASRPRRSEMRKEGNVGKEERVKTVGKDQLTPAAQRELARVFQIAAVSHITTKVALCLRQLEGIGISKNIDDKVDGEGGDGFKEREQVKVTGLVVSGGVGSNLYLREELKKMLGEVSPGVELYYPPVHLCTDNAAMIAWTAILRLRAGLITEPPNLGIRKKWSLEELYNDVPEESYRHSRP